MNQFWILDFPPIADPLAPRTPLREIMRWYLILFVLVVHKPLLICNVSAAERTKPIRIGVLTDSWGPTPGTASGFATALRSGVTVRTRIS